MVLSLFGFLEFLMSDKSRTVVVARRPFMSHESTGVPPVQVSKVFSWTCHAPVVRDEGLVIPEPCGGVNADWDDICIQCRAPRPKKPDE